MKGLVFNEFFKRLEQVYDEVALDEVIMRAALPHGGAYTNVGTYPFSEMLDLVAAHHAVTGEPVTQMLTGFGQHCIESWALGASHFLGRGRDLFDVLSEINGFHEREVRKLYPDAELPTFTVESRDARVMVLGYHSAKRLTALAMGAIKGAARHLGQPVSVAVEAVAAPSGDYDRFRIERLDACPFSHPVASCPAPRT